MAYLNSLLITAAMDLRYKKWFKICINYKTLLKNIFANEFVFQKQFLLISHIQMNNSEAMKG